MVLKCLYCPEQTIKTNVIGTLNMLGLAKRVGARLVIMPIDSSDVKNYIKRKLCSIAGFC
jgi:FlaA1/EpsC-like NDP-sugar epimerase